MKQKRDVTTAHRDNDKYTLVLICGHQEIRKVKKRRSRGVGAARGLRSEEDAAPIWAYCKTCEDTCADDCASNFCYSCKEPKIHSQDCSKNPPRPGGFLLVGEHGDCNCHRKGSED